VVDCPWTNIREYWVGDYAMVSVGFLPSYCDSRWRLSPSLPAWFRRILSSSTGTFALFSESGHVCITDLHPSITKGRFAEEDVDPAVRDLMYVCLLSNESNTLANMCIFSVAESGSMFIHLFR
jgi:hypothetical protein